MRRLLKSMAYTAVAAVAAYNVYLASDIQQAKSDLTFDTIELTASGIEYSNVPEPPGYYDKKGGCSNNSTPIINVYIIGPSLFVTWEETDTYNGFWQTFSQGILKDEREAKRVCPAYQSGQGSGQIDAIRAGVSGSGSTTQINSFLRYEIICPYGNENCVEEEC